MPASFLRWALFLYIDVYSGHVHRRAMLHGDSIAVAT